MDNKINNQINLLHNDLVINEIIEDVNDSTWKQFKQQYLKLALASISLALVVPFFAFIYNALIAPEDAFLSLTVLVPFFLITVSLPLFFFYAKISGKIQRAFMMQFARLNNFTYSETAPLPEEKAHFFFVGHSKRIENYITGTLFDRPIFLYNFHFTQGGGKYRKYSNYTVFNIDLPYHVPALIFKPNTVNLDFLYNDVTKKENGFSNKSLISLEGDLNEYFKLWVENKFEIEALQIFTKQFLYELFLDWKDFHIEFIDKNVYVYVDHVINTKVELESLFALVKALLKHVDAISVGLSGSTEAMKFHTDPKTKVI